MGKVGWGPGADGGSWERQVGWESWDGGPVGVLAQGAPSYRSYPAYLSYPPPGGGGGGWER